MVQSGFETPGCPGRGRTAGLPGIGLLGVGSEGRVLGIDGLVIGSVGLIEGKEGFVVGSVGLVLGIDGRVEGTDGFIPPPGLGMAGFTDGSCGVDGVGKLGRVVGFGGFGLVLGIGREGAEGIGREGIGRVGADGVGRGMGVGRDMLPPDGRAPAPCGIRPLALRDIPLNPSANA